MWRTRAACREAEPEIFFPPRGGTNIKDAVAYCRRCPVAEQCLAEAMRRPVDGIWAGTTPLMRRRRRPVREPRPHLVERHGTITAYKTAGCRCPECRAANAAYARKQRAS